MNSLGTKNIHCVYIHIEGNNFSKKKVLNTLNKEKKYISIKKKTILQSIPYLLA